MVLLQRLVACAPEAIMARYKLKEEHFELDAYDLLEQVGRNRGMLQSGGVVNTERTAMMLLDEFRSSKLGNISLEKPDFSCKGEEHDTV